MDRELLSQIRHHLLRPLATRVANTVARAIVQLVDDSTKQQMIQVGVLEDEDVDDGEHFQPYGFSAVPLPGAEAIALFPNGDRGHPLVIAASDRRYRPTGGAAGEVTVYNNAGASLTMTKDGDIIGKPAPGRQFLVSDGGSTEPVVKQSEFLAHGHATAGTGAPVGPMSVAPVSAALFPGTSTLRAK